MADNADKPEEAVEKKPAAKKAPAKKAPAKKADTKTTTTAKKTATKKTAAASKDSDVTATDVKETTAAADTPTKKASATKKAPAKKTAAKTAEKKPEPQQTEGAGGLLKTHHLRPAPGAHTKKTRVGRGEGSKGKTAGRGTKGTKARYQVPARFEGGQMPIHMRLPKLRGFKNPFRTEYQVVNLETLAALYPSGGEVTVEDLVAKGAVRAGRLVKILGTGEVSVAFSVTADAFSASAKDKIVAAGGLVNES